MEDLRICTKMEIKAVSNQINRGGSTPVRLRDPEGVGRGSSTQRPNYWAIKIFQNEDLKVRTRLAGDVPA